MNESGVTDSGLRYIVVRSPDQEGATVLDVSPGKKRRWPTDAPFTMVGQGFGMRWAGRVIQLRVVTAELRDSGMMRLTCR